MPWTATDAEEHTKKADTQAKRDAWAKAANARRKQCLAAIEGEPSEAQVKACDASAIKVANALVGNMKEQDAEPEPGGPETCVCPDCDYEVKKKRGVPCRSMTCPECGAKLVAGAEEEMEMEVRQIVRSALELAFGAGMERQNGDISAGRAEKILKAAETDLQEALRGNSREHAIEFEETFEETVIPTSFDVDGEQVSLCALVQAYRELSAITESDYLCENDTLAEMFGSVLNPYGKRSSKGYPGGRDGWKKAWRVMMSGGNQGTIQGTIRRASMIGAGMGCKLPTMTAEDVKPRSGPCGKLAGEWKHTPSDYGLSKWKTPSDDNLTADDVKLTCEDLTDIKRMCLEEIAKRHACAEKKEMEASEVAESAVVLGEVADYDGDLTGIGLEESSVVVGIGRRAPVLVDFQIIRPGPGNKRDKHFYPADVLERDIHVFEGVDVFACDHVDSERSERTKVGKLLKAPSRFTAERAPVGQVLIYDPHHAEKTRNRADAGELGTLECSIFGVGKARPGEIDGKEYKVVEALTEGRYLELVSKAGAGGRALNLAESENGGKGNMEDEEKEKKPEPAPVEEVEIEEATGDEQKMLAEAEVKETLQRTNLPEFARRALAAGRYADAAALEKSIAEAVDEVKALTGSGEVAGLGEREGGNGTGETLEEFEERDEAEFNEIMKRHGMKEV
jgi:hypothetical protein